MHPKLELLPRASTGIPAFGRVRRAMSVVKKRTGPHEDTIRELHIGSKGLTLGEPLEEFQGVLRGVPTYVGKSPPLTSGVAHDFNNLLTVVLGNIRFLERALTKARPLRSSLLIGGCLWRL